MCFIEIFSEFIIFFKLKWYTIAFLRGEELTCKCYAFWFCQGFTDDQLVLVEQNTLMVEEREREIRQIVQSISDLNEIFRDLGAMIVEQVREFTFLVAGFPAIKSGPSPHFFGPALLSGKKTKNVSLMYVCMCVTAHLHVSVCMYKLHTHTTVHLYKTTVNHFFR